MKINLFKTITTLACSSAILFSSGAYAYDWSWAEEEIINSNFGQAAGFVIDSVSFTPGEEYLVEEEGVCIDYTVTVKKHRDVNRAGRGKMLEVTDVEIETFCQAVEEAV